ncbi:adenylate cyclase type 10-like isoform X7 [Panthera tigris]|uniref:adenylate cyclase type 10-like isoform X7 n=1 Tax=Panthera tigris TaxID=9694 RepID=UPI001C6F9802|nr:adenylate cyclase type 10-like isoform X7 [Panthera tigris]
MSPRLLLKHLHSSGLLPGRQELERRREKQVGRGPEEACTYWLVGGTRQGCRCGLAATWTPSPGSGKLAGNRAAAMATGERAAVPSLWPVEARLAALLPDLLVFRKPRGPEPELATAQGVLLGVHVTGFTALMDRFSLTCKSEHDMDKLAHIFSYYISDIVEHVLCFGGDILNITGNVLLALWTVKQNQLSDIITLVAKCSLEIQEKFGIYHTKEGQDLQLKIGLSAGQISQVIVGDEQRQYLLVVGQDVDDVQLAQRLAQANEIVLSWNCWKLCEQYMFEVEIMREDEAVKLRDMRIIDPFDFDEHFDKCLDYLPHYQTSADTLRTALDLDPDSALEQTLRKHIMKNLLKKIDEGQPTEYVSEFRTVTMVLVSLEFHKSAWVLHLCHLIQEAALYISTVIEKGGGQLSRIFMFEKGCMFLCVFGLPGDKKPDECAHALESSFSIFSFCWEKLAETKLVSISITNGPVFCGVIGAVARHEYTVIGPKVSLVARMITAYPGLVSCDEVTYLRSMLPAYNFKKLPEKMMKNISNPGKMYEYLGHRRCIMFGKRHLARERNKNHPLLDREKELEAFRMAQQGCLHQKEGHAVLYEGGKGYGKSQLLAEINFLAQKEGHRVLPLKLKETDFKQCFYAIQTLMAIFFEIDTCPAYYRQECLHKQLCGMVEEPLHCLFNDLFFVKFPLSFKVSHMDDLTRQKKVKACFFQVLQEAVRETPLIFLIDEAQYMDAASWEFLETLLSSVPIIMVMTLTPTITLCDCAQHFLQSSQAVLVPILKLAATSLLRMACWELGVVSIPQELQIYLLHRCFGNPLYCEVLCQDLLSKDILVFHDLQKEEENNKWETLSANAVKSTMYNIPPAGSEDQELYICTVKDDVNLDTVLLPPLLKEIAVNQLDQLSPEEQLLVKCAAVIGHCFQIDLLQHLLPGWDKNKLLQVLKVLVDIHVFLWFNKSQELPAESILVPSSIKIIEQTKEEKKKKSDADSPLSPQEELSLPQTEVLEFGVPLLREAAWELWPRAQQIALHLECACFLRDLACRCGSCHGGDFVPFHRFAICSTKSCSGTSRFCSYKDTGSVLTQVITDRLQLPSPQDSFQFQTKECRSQEAFTSEHCSKKKLAVLQQRVRCLSLLWQLYNLETTTSSRRFAGLATLMQKNSAEELASGAPVVSTYVALSQFSQNMGDRDRWLHCEQVAIQKSSLCWFSREGLLATAQLMQALAYTKLCLGHLDFSIKLGFQAREICRHLKKPALETLVLSVLFRSAFLKKKFDLCVHVLESQWVLISQGHDVLGLACFYSACLDLLLYGKGLLCRPFSECLCFVQRYEHSCILNSQSNVMLGVHSSLAMWFAQNSQWNLFEQHFSKAHQLVKRTNASLFGSHGFVRFLECHVLMLQKMPEDVFMHTLPETRSQALKYFKEFFSRCVTCPVYHQWVSELKASVMRSGKGESMSLTDIIRPFDTCLTRIWIEGEFLEENNSFGGNLGIQRFDRVADVRENKDEEEIQECIC